MKDTQKAWLLKELRAGRSVTPLDALRDAGIFRLAARVHDLRSEGWPVSTTLVKDGDTRFARYAMGRQ